MSSSRRAYHLVYVGLIALLSIALICSISNGLKGSKGIRQQSSKLNSHLINVANVVDDPLYEEVRVLCLIPYNYNYPSAARYVRRTWGRHCNVLLFVSGDSNEELEPFVPRVNASVDWDLVRDGLVYAYEYYKTDVDWFLKVEDYSFVAVENLRYMLQKYSPQDPLYLGYRLKDEAKNKPYVYWRSGYVISKEAMRRFAEASRNPNITECKGYKSRASEDMELSRCLFHVGVETADSRDEFGLETFMPIKLKEHFLKGYTVLPWLRTLSWDGAGNTTVPMSRRAIAFRLGYPPEMYSWYYLVYHVHLFGLPIPQLSSSQSSFSSSGLS